MFTEVKPPEPVQTQWYDIPFPATAYKFPEEALIQQVRLDEEYIHLYLTDGRVLSILLWWIPTVYHAAPQERIKFSISPDRRAVIWDPDDTAINDELMIQDYLGGRSGRNG